MTDPLNPPTLTDDETSDGLAPNTTLGDEIARPANLLFTVGMAVDSIASTSKPPEHHHCAALRATAALDGALVQLRYISAVLDNAA